MQQSWQSFEALKLTQQLAKSFPTFEQQNQQKSNKYQSNFQFLLSIVGMSVGYGSFWRFPYLIYKNGGGVFLIPYLSALVLIGIPLLYFEGAIGQMFQQSLPFSLAKINKGLKGMGIVFSVVNLMIQGFYNILLAYSYRFLFTSFNPNLPFKSQSPQENTYFHDVVLQKSESISQFGGIMYPLLVLYIASLIVCYFIIKNGVKGSEKIIKVTVILPYLLLIFLLVRALFLEGALQGIYYLFVPQLGNLFKAQIWIDAAVQVFIQFSIGYGVVYNLSCLKLKKFNLIKTTVAVPISILACGMLSALCVFMYLGHFCKQLNLDLRQLQLQGIQLSFNIFPKALAILPWPNLWLFIFALCLVLLGIDTLFACFQAFYSYLDEQFPQDQILIKIGSFQIKNEHIKQLLMVFLTLTFGICECSRAGIYYLAFFDQFCYSVPLSINAVFFLYMFTRVFSIWQIQLEIIRSTRLQTPKWIRRILVSKYLMAFLIVNLVLAVINQAAMVNSYPIALYLLGWLLSLSPFLFAVVYWYIRKQKTWRLTFQDIKSYKQIQNK